MRGKGHAFRVLLGHDWALHADLAMVLRRWMSIALVTVGVRVAVFPIILRQVRSTYRMSVRSPLACKAVHWLHDCLNCRLRILLCYARLEKGPSGRGFGRGLKRSEHCPGMSHCMLESNNDECLSCGQESQRWRWCVYFVACFRLVTCVGITCLRFIKKKLHPSIRPSSPPFLLLCTHKSP